MSGEHRQLVDSWMQALNEGHPAAVGGLLGSSVVGHGHDSPDSQCRESLREWFAGLHALCPSGSLAGAEEVHFWDELADRWAVHLCGCDEAQAAQAVEKAAAGSGTMVIRMENGKAVAGWFIEDKGDRAPLGSGALGSE